MHSVADSVNPLLHTLSTMTKTAAISVRIDPKIKAAAQKAAAADRRTVASFVEKVLVEYLVKKGYLDAAD